MAMWSCWNTTALPGTTCYPPIPSSHLNLQLQGILERSSYSSTVTHTPVCVRSVASVVSDSLRLYGLSRLHCPWDSAGKNTGMGCHALLPNPGIESRSPALQGDFLPTLSHLGSPLPLLPSHNPCNNGDPLTMEIQLAALIHI